MNRHDPAPTQRADDSLGSGIESGIVLVIFSLAGFGLDRWLDTTPWFTIIVFFVGAIGVFYRYKAAYSVRIDQLARDRRDASMGRPRQ